MQRTQKVYANHKKCSCAIIYGQCTLGLDAQLNRDDESTNDKDDQDVVELLKLL